MIKLMKWLDIAALSVAALSIVVMMLIVSWDAVSRYLLHAPLVWSFEIITYYLLGISLYMAVSATFKDGDHVNIDLFRVFFAPWVRARLDAAWCLLSAGAFAIMVYGAVKQSLRALERGTFMPGYIMWPAWITYAIIALGLAVLTLRLVLHAAQLTLRGEDNQVTVSGEPTE